MLYETFEKMIPFFLEWENLGRRPTVNECTRPLSQRNPELFITFLLHNDQDTPSYSKV